MAASTGQERLWRGWSSSARLVGCGVWPWPSTARSMLEPVSSAQTSCVPVFWNRALLTCDLVVAFCYLNTLQLKSVKILLWCWAMWLSSSKKILKPVVTVLEPKGACPCEPVANMRAPTMLFSGHGVFAVSTQSTLIGSCGV